MEIGLLIQSIREKVKKIPSPLFLVEVKDGKEPLLVNVTEDTITCTDQRNRKHQLEDLPMHIIIDIENAISNGKVFLPSDGMFE